VLLSFVALVVILGVPAAPAEAVAAPVATAPTASAVEAEREGLNITMSVIAVGLVLTVGMAVVCRPRIAHERAIRRFRGTLHDADIVARCKPPIVTHQDRAGHQEPPFEPQGT